MSDETTTTAAPVAAPQSCREVFISLGQAGDPALTAAQQAECAQIGKVMTNHPVVGLMLQHAILWRYQRATGKDLAGTIDWKGILTWFVQNADSLLPLILQIITLFGA
jgi:hypothetical protein